MTFPPTMPPSILFQCMAHIHTPSDTILSSILCSRLPSDGNNTTTQSQTLNYNPQKRLQCKYHLAIQEIPTRYPNLIALSQTPQSLPNQWTSSSPNSTPPTHITPPHLPTQPNYPPSIAPTLEISSSSPRAQTTLTNGKEMDWRFPPYELPNKLSNRHNQQPCTTWNAS